MAWDDRIYIWLDETRLGMSATLPVALAVLVNRFFAGVVFSRWCRCQLAPFKIDGFVLQSISHGQYIYATRAIIVIWFH